jgi:hypothetical protein
VKSAGIEITHQAVEKISMLDQNLKTILQALVWLIGDKRQVCMHDYQPWKCREKRSRPERPDKLTLSIY